MKSPWEWTEEDLISLIAAAERESITLDYKACDALARTDGKKNELSKDISAFANSAGGTIVYGIIEDGRVPTRIDGGYDPSEISKEWIEQVINTRIQRRIDGIRINQIWLYNSAPGKAVYAIHVPQSSRAPHQASDKRFYKRFNFESVPMEEYEVRDTSMRSEAPALTLAFSVINREKREAVYHEESLVTLFEIMPAISNDAPTPAEYAVIHLFIDTRLLMPRGVSGLSESGEAELSVGGSSFSCRRLSINHSIPGKLPIFQGVSFRLLNEALVVAAPAPGRYLIASNIIAPRAGAKLEVSFFALEGNMASIDKL